MFIRLPSGELKKSDDSFSVNQLDVERLLHEWRWLCPGRMTLVARNAFGDLFLRNEEDQVLWLEVAGGQLTKLTDSEAHFQACLQVEEFREHWFAERDEHGFALRGFVPNADQCIGFSVPLVFKEGGAGNKAYLVDLYEGVSFLGDLHRQLRNVKDGDQVRLVVGREPTPGNEPV